LLTEIDVAALNLAIERARADPERTEQVEWMLVHNPRVEVGEFCAYSCQRDALRLLPWQTAPMDVDDPDGDHEAARLLKQMLDLGISRYHPDPVAAIEDAQKL
jgi:hypothetical protein